MTPTKQTNGCSSISSNLLIQEAKDRGYSVEILDSKNDFFIIGIGKEKKLFKNIDAGLNNTLSNKICNEKHYTYMFLEQIGARVPKTIIINASINKKELKKELLAHGLSFPLVVKPSGGAHGDGVSCNLCTMDGILEAINLAKQHKGKILLQEFFCGYDHRIFMVGDRIIAVMQRIPPYIIGDGKHTIKELIEEENQNPLRGEGHSKALSYIPIDEELDNLLKKQNKDKETILVQGEALSLRGNANLSTGGISIDQTDTIHPSIIEMCQKIVRHLNLQICGIDYLSEDISKPLPEQKGGFIEINTTPGIRGHHFPAIGKGRNVAKAILDHTFQIKFGPKQPILTDAK